jgi:RNA polymerase-binding transcription factor DksA
MVATATFKKLLEQERVTLESQLDTIGRPNPTSPGNWEAVQNDTELESDPHDQADQLDQYQENRALVDVLNKRHRDVIEALMRIENGTYGKCEVDGRPIEKDRLAADPAAKTCKTHILSV